MSISCGFSPARLRRSTGSTARKASRSRPLRKAVRPPTMARLRTSTERLREKSPSTNWAALSGSSPRTDAAPALRPDPRRRGGRPGRAGPSPGPPPAGDALSSACRRAPEPLHQEVRLLTALAASGSHLVELLHSRADPRGLLVRHVRRGGQEQAALAKTRSPRRSTSSLRPGTSA